MAYYTIYGTSPKGDTHKSFIGHVKKSEVDEWTAQATREGWTQLYSGQWTAPADLPSAPETWSSMRRPKSSAPSSASS